MEETVCQPRQSIRERVTVWRAQPGPQTALITCPVQEIFFGGARGGGKTYGIIGDWLQHNRVYGAKTGGLIVRRTRKQLQDFIEKASPIIEQIGGRWNEVNKLFRMPNRAPLHCAYLERDSDAENYQGWGLTRVYGEEIGNFPHYAPLAKLKAALRSGEGIPSGMRHTGNPGGPGHTWVKARYIDPAPLGWQIIPEYVKRGIQSIYVGDRIFIPSKVSDNILLTANDPTYVLRILQSGNEALVRAWLDGDWSVIAGAYFPEFDPGLHVVHPEKLPAHWVRFRAMDAGMAKPFCVLWFAVSDGSHASYPRGALICYREWYGTNEQELAAGHANIGLKLTAEQIADGIIEREHADGERGLIEKIDMSVIDPAARQQHGGPSYVERMATREYMGVKGVHFHSADNTRIGTRGSMSGWDAVRQRLKGDEHNDDTRPLIYFFSTCVHSIRTLPALQHDPDHPEDVDTDGEDHAPDTIRYACLARPWVRAAPKPAANPALAVHIGQETSGLSIQAILDARARKRRGS